MLVLISDLLSGFLILFITVLLNGDMGTKYLCPLPLVGLLHHKQFIKSPYMLVYFYVVFTVMMGFKLLPGNTLTGLMLYLILLGCQVLILVLFFYKKYQKKSDSWLMYIEQITDMLGRLVMLLRKPASQTQDNEKQHSLTLTDIQFLFHQLVFPGIFVVTNAYLIVNLFIFFQFI